MENDHIASEELRERYEYNAMVGWLLVVGIGMLVWAGLREQEWLWELKTPKALYWQQFSRRWFYPMVVLHAGVLLRFSWQYGQWRWESELRTRTKLWVLIASWCLMVSCLSVAWANNVVNVMHGRSLHHHGPT